MESRPLIREAMMPLNPIDAPKVYDLNLFLAHIDQFQLLTGQEEIELAKLIQGGNQEARERLIQHNLRLVVNIARQYVHGHRSLPDLINEGNLGLIHAVCRFKPVEHQTRFSTYASWWIKQSIRNSIKNTQWPVRIPAYMHTLITAMRKYGLTDPMQLDTPEGVEILKKCRHGRPVKESTIRQAKLGMYAATLGLIEGSPLGEDSFLDEYSKEGDPNPLDGVVIRENETILLDALDSLEPREKEVLKLRFGLGSHSMTLREVGEQLELTRERVRQIEVLALQKMREKVEAA